MKEKQPYKQSEASQASGTGEGLSISSPTETEKKIPFWVYIILFVILMPIVHMGLTSVFNKEEPEVASSSETQTRIPVTKQSVTQDQERYTGNFDDYNDGEEVESKAPVRRPAQTSQQGSQMIGINGEMRKDKYKVAIRNVDGDIEFVHPNDPRVETSDLQDLRDEEKNRQAMEKISINKM